MILSITSLLLVFSFHTTVPYNPKIFIEHTKLLCQTFVHCKKFLTAAFRRSLGRISVPMWLYIFSNQLRIIALVSCYLTNKLLRYTLIDKRSKTFFTLKSVLIKDYQILIYISISYFCLTGRLSAYYSPVRHWNINVPVRLACIMYFASIHSEPGSNS